MGLLNKAILKDKLIKSRLPGECQGFSIIETMAAMVILGIIMAFTAMIIKRLFVSPKITLKSEAFILASNEIDHAINNNITTDTSYYNKKGSLLVLRKITEEKDSLFDINVSVKFKQTNEEIITLKANKSMR